MKNLSRKKKSILILFIIAAILIVGLLVSCLVSYLKFDTANPFAAANGYIQIVYNDKEYVEIQSSPKVMLSQPNDLLLKEFMESRGYTEIEEERLGGLRVFSNGTDKEWIMYSQNAYFSKWAWE